MLVRPSSECISRPPLPGVWVLILHFIGAAQNYVTDNRLVHPLSLCHVKHLSVPATALEHLSLPPCRYDPASGKPAKINLASLTIHMDMSDAVEKEDRADPGHEPMYGIDMGCDHECYHERVFVSTWRPEPKFFNRFTTAKLAFVGVPFQPWPFLDRTWVRDGGPPNAELLASMRVTRAAARSIARMFSVGEIELRNVNLYVCQVTRDEEDLRYHPDDGGDHDHEAYFFLGPQITSALPHLADKSWRIKWIVGNSTIDVPNQLTWGDGTFRTAHLAEAVIVVAHQKGADYVRDEIAKLNPSSVGPLRIEVASS